MESATTRGLDPLRFSVLRYTRTLKAALYMGDSYSGAGLCKGLGAISSVG